MWRHDLPEASLASVEVTLSSQPPQAEQESCAWASRVASRLNSQPVGFDVTRMRFFMPTHSNPANSHQTTPAMTTLAMTTRDTQTVAEARTTPQESFEDVQHRFRHGIHSVFQVDGPIVQPVKKQKLNIHPAINSPLQGPPLIPTPVKSYEETKEVFERTHAKVGFEYVRESCEKGCRVVVRYSAAKFKKLYKHMRCVVMKGIKGNVKEVSFITEWMNDHYIRNFGYFGIYPDPNGLSSDKCPHGMYNLSGVSVETKKKKKVIRLLY